ncbi:MAG: hypothetical protein V5A88_08815 [Candidatus Thermoplasmatota archaeon]
MLEIINPHVAKISLALREGDSIAHLSRKIGSSYGWTHKWISELEEIGVVERDEGIKIVDEEFIAEFKELGKGMLRRNLELEEAYLLPNFSGLSYAFTKTDAVFIWTKGGYQIARSKEDYPLFIKILREELEEWKDYFEDLSVKYSVEERSNDEDGIYFVLFPVEEFESEWIENTSVIPLKETVRWAKKYEVNFQPALEMLDEMHDLKLDIRYKERGRV